MELALVVRKVRRTHQPSPKVKSALSLQLVMTVLAMLRVYWNKQAAYWIVVRILLHLAYVLGIVVSLHERVTSTKKLDLHQ